MPPFWQEACLLFTIIGLPVGLAAFCVVFSRRQQGRLLSYFAYFLMFGFAGQGLLTITLWPSNLSRLMGVFLLTVAPVASAALAVCFHFGPPRIRFDTGAMAVCYLYSVLAVVTAVAMRGVFFG